MKIEYARGKKFDLQLVQGQAAEHRLGLLLSGDITAEVKSEAYLWEKTGNIAIEYEYRGKPSGISTTEADVWVHELRRDGEPVMTLVIPVPRLKELCRKAYRARRIKSGGDGDQSKMVLLRIVDLIRAI